MERTKKTNLKFNILAIICIVIICFAVSPITLQNDTYYTIKIGEHIMQNGVDMHDPFSWHNLPYTYPHWAYDVMIYQIYNAFGMIGITVSTYLFASILGIILYFAISDLTKDKVIALVVTILTIYILEPYIAARAQLITFILFAIEIYLIEKFLQFKKKRYVVGLIILSIIIANVHAAVWPVYFVFFLPYIAEYIFSLLSDTIINKKIKIFAITKRIEKLKQKQGKEEQIQKLENELKATKEKQEKIQERREETKKNPYKLIIKKENNVKYLIIIAIICLFTGLLTPIGDTPYTYLIKTMQGTTTNNINEHQPIVLINSENAMIIIIIYIALLTFSNVKVRLKDLLMIGGLCFLTLMSSRQLSLFALIGSFTMAKILKDFIEINRSENQEKGKLLKTLTTPFAQIVIIGITLIGGLYLIKPKVNDKIVDENSYPVEAATYILENLDVQNIKLYNEYNYGSYLLFRGIPVFIDSRADVYDPMFNSGRDIFSDFINVSSLDADYEEIFDKYEITHAIMYKSSKLNTLISKDTNYTKIYEDKNFVIYEKD